MFTHNLNPVIFEIGFIEIRWYSLAYIFGILIGWYYGKFIIRKKFSSFNDKISEQNFDDFVTYLIISIILGGRIGYVIFYNFKYYLVNPFDILKIWEGGMSFHGAMIGIIIGTFIFSKKKKIQRFFLLDIVACVSPIGIFLGRIANFINGELVCKATNAYWAVIFPEIDNIPRHPSQLYEAILEGLVLFLIMNYIFFNKNYKIGNCSSLFLIYYGIFRIFCEFFRQPDIQIGYFFNFISMGILLSIFMILAGSILYYKKNVQEFKKF